MSTHGFWMCTGVAAIALARVLGCTARRCKASLWVHQTRFSWLCKCDVTAASTADNSVGFISATTSKTVSNRSLGMVPPMPERPSGTSQAIEEPARCLPSHSVAPCHQVGIPTRTPIGGTSAALGQASCLFRHPRVDGSLHFSCRNATSTGGHTVLYSVARAFDPPLSWRNHWVRQRAGSFIPPSPKVADVRQRRGSLSGS